MIAWAGATLWWPARRTSRLRWRPWAATKRVCTQARVVAGPRERGWPRCRSMRTGGCLTLWPRTGAGAAGAAWMGCWPMRAAAAAGELTTPAVDGMRAEARVPCVWELGAVLCSCAAAAHHPYPPCPHRRVLGALCLRAGGHDGAIPGRLPGLVPRGPDHPQGQHPGHDRGARGCAPGRACGGGGGGGAGGGGAGRRGRVWGERRWGGRWEWGRSRARVLRLAEVSSGSCCCCCCRPRRPSSF